MMREAWRIVKTKYASQAFDGEGARQFGGRWNSIGRRVVYTSSSLSLAILELLVHLETSAILPAYSLFCIQLEESLIWHLPGDTLPTHWRETPAPSELRFIGDQWLTEERSVALAVPSVIVPQEENFLLNPGHPDFARLTIKPPQPFSFDERLL